MAQTPLFGREAFLHRDNFFDQSVESWNYDKKIADQTLRTPILVLKNKIYNL